MCETCGCSGDARTTVIGPATPHAHDHSHDPLDDHTHAHSHSHDAESARRTLVLEQRLLAKNDEIADHNRTRLDALRALAVNVMGSPGAGKTTLLERTVRELGTDIPLIVVEGDQETSLDADRIEAAGGRVAQINTGTGCHLDASMIAGALDLLEPPRGAVVLVENVGNLVCPALFDLGARATAVLASVTEGADKPLKYPHMFRAADLVVLTKIDILPYVDFRVGEFVANARAVNPSVEVLHLSASTGDGVDRWLDWVRRMRDARA